MVYSIKKAQSHKEVSKITIIKQKKAAKAFVKRWQAAEGNEQREANSFWTELCQEILDVPNATHVLEFERKVRGKRIDVFYEDHGILIENKSRGIDLDKKEQRGKNNDGSPRMVTPYEQARWYADYITPRSIAPKYILTCNFDEIRIYDTDEEYPEKTYETIRLEELPNLYHRLSFFTEKENSRAEREKNLSVSAGEVVGKLYDAFSKSYHDIENNENEQRSLNMLITRIVFLLYAEDSGNLKVRNQFYNYMNNYQTAHMRTALRDLFLILNTKEEERDSYLPEELADFPYINGGLFKDEIIIPQFTDEARDILLKEASSEFDWANISPTIFGAVFESTLTAKKRREGGMHYTSVENIHKVTGPLFYDELMTELTTIEGIKTHKERQFKLQKYREKLASLRIIDPACGSGNFLTETYLSLRKLENRVLEDLKYDQVEGQMAMGQMNPIMVSLDQFYGIEIDDFAVSVAKTALWIAQLQMTFETSEVVGEWIEPLPLKSNDNIVCGNALRMNWNDVLPAEQCDYIIGNPPFIGYSNHSKEQEADRAAIFGKVKTVDYVACWYWKAAEYMGELPIYSAFVSTNSICQGQQVEPIWKPLFDRGFHIDFAWPTFVWDNEATDQAHVHVVIVGFSKQHKTTRTLFVNNEVTHPNNINAYLTASPNVFIEKHTKPLCDVPSMAAGGKPSDGQNLILETDEAEALIAVCPEAKRWIKPFSMGAEFIKGQERWCLWLVGITKDELEQMKPVQERVERVRSMRLESKKPATQKKANTPWLFDEVRPPQGGNYIAVPKVSSGRRNYVPMGFVTNGMIPGDKLFFISGAGLYEFGILMSQFHNAWMRVVAGRLKSDYSYANTIVYNNFVWPETTDEQRQTIEACAQAVLDARNNHPEDSLATLYDPDKMPADLLAAHKALDASVEAAYGVDFKGDEEKIVSHLFKLYYQMIEGKEEPKAKSQTKLDSKRTTIIVKVRKKNT